MARTKPFSKTELKILIFNKMKQGKSYERAKKEIADEIAKIIANSKKLDNEKKKEKSRENEKSDRFKKKFKEMTDGENTTD